MNKIEFIPRTWPPYGEAGDFQLFDCHQVGHSWFSIVLCTHKGAPDMLFEFPGQNPLDVSAGVWELP